MSSVLVEDFKVITWKTVHVIIASALLRYWPYIWTLNGRAEDKVDPLGVDSQAISREGNGPPLVKFGVRIKFHKLTLSNSGRELGWRGLGHIGVEDHLPTVTSARVKSSSDFTHPPGRVTPFCEPSYTVRSA
jgi:hypothetical protein